MFFYVVVFMEEADVVRTDIEYPVFKRVRPVKVSLKEVKRITSKIRGSLAEEIVREREREWR